MHVRDSIIVPLLWHVVGSFVLLCRWRLGPVTSWLTSVRGIQPARASPVLGVVVDKHVIRHSQQCALNRNGRAYSHLKIQSPNIQHISFSSSSDDKTIDLWWYQAKDAKIVKLMIVYLLQSKHDVKVSSNCNCLHCLSRTRCVLRSISGDHLRLFIDLSTMFVIVAPETGFVFTLSLLWDKFHLTTVDKYRNPRATED